VPTMDDALSAASTARWVRRNFMVSLFTSSRS
jgi:hypothetical protein